MNDRLTTDGQTREGLPHSPLSRRNLLRWAGAAAVGLAVRPVHASAHAEAFHVSGVELPPDLGQANLRVYVPATGHTVGGLFLDYWRANGAAAVYGNPISEPFASADGYYSQAFENGVFQYRPEVLYTADPIVRLMRIGDLAEDARRGRRSVLWRRLDQDSEEVERVIAEGGTFVPETGHTIAGSFLDWYTFHEGSFYLGHPLSEPFVEDGIILQYFEGGRLEGTAGDVRLGPLAMELAPQLGIDTARVPQGDLPVYDESLFWTANNPNPVGDPSAPGPKWVEINIGSQQISAYQGQTLVSSSLVSTGLEPNVTETGMFHVRLKYPQQDMAGFTNSTGEVISVGETGTRRGTRYEVTDVPHVMYFNMDAEALHGAYWHNNFGQKMSHGCVNLPLDVAAWMYGWAPLGTGVWVHP